MVKPELLTVEHYQALTAGAYEYSIDAKPMDLPSLQARRAAIREGRLIVLDSIDQDARPCSGCAAQPPSAARGLIDPADVLNNGGSYNTPGFNTGSTYTTATQTPGGWLINPSTLPLIDTNAWYNGPGAPPLPPPADPIRLSIRPSTVVTNAGGQEIILFVEKVEIDAGKGACKDSGSGCVADTDCKFVVKVTVRAASVEEKPVTFPTFTVAGPGSASGSAAPSNVNSSAGASTATYVYEFTLLVPCGNQISQHISFAKVDGLGGMAWSSATFNPPALNTIAGDDDVLWVRYTCESCRGSEV